MEFNPKKRQPRVGEVFEHEGLLLRCLRSPSCKGCVFDSSGLCPAPEENDFFDLTCSSKWRDDGYSVKFILYDDEQLQTH